MEKKLRFYILEIYKTNFTIVTISL